MNKLIALLLVTLFAGNAGELLFPGKLRKNVVRTQNGTVEVRNGAWAAFQDIPVQERKRYRVKIRARIKKGNALETVPAMEQPISYAVWNRKGFPWKLAVINYMYLSGGKRLGILYHGTPLPVFSTVFRDYILDFYAIDGADAVRVFVSTNSSVNTVEVKNAEAEEVNIEEEKYLNANADLDLGPYNPTGYGYGGKAMFGRDDSGPFLDIGTGWALGDSIPVTAGDRLKISYSGTPAESCPAMHFKAFFHQSAQWSVRNVGTNKIPMRIGKKREEGSIEVVVPENAKWMRLCFSHGTLRYLRVEKVKTEK